MPNSDRNRDDPNGDITSPNGDGQAPERRHAGFSFRLQHAAKQKGLGVSELAKRHSLSRGTFTRYWTGERLPQGELLFDLADDVGVDARYLVCGGARLPSSTDERDPRARQTEITADQVAIDSLDLSYGMGGTFVDVEPGAMEIEKAQFSRAWLRKFTHAPPDMLFTTSGVGDSMRPTIEDHDVVIVDRSARLEDELGEKIWAVVFGGVGMIKRLRPMPDGTVKLMSDNQAVRDERATDNDLHIIGRVVAVVRRQ